MSIEKRRRKRNKDGENRGYWYSSGRDEDIESMSDWIYVRDDRNSAESIRWSIENAPQVIIPSRLFKQGHTQPKVNRHNYNHVVRINKINNQAYSPFEDISLKELQWT